jgi:hypothetical protein
MLAVAHSTPVLIPKSPTPVSNRNHFSESVKIFPGDAFHRRWPEFTDQPQNLGPRLPNRCSEFRPGFFAFRSRPCAPQNLLLGCRFVTPRPHAGFFAFCSRLCSPRNLPLSYRLLLRGPRRIWRLRLASLRITRRNLRHASHSSTKTDSNPRGFRILQIRAAQTIAAHSERGMRLIK